MWLAEMRVQLFIRHQVLRTCPIPKQHSIDLDVNDKIRKHETGWSPRYLLIDTQERYRLVKQLVRCIFVRQAEHLSSYSRASHTMLSYASAVAQGNVSGPCQLSMGKAYIRLFATTKPINLRPPKLAWLIIWWPKQMLNLPLQSAE
jgi:hypothetical protein